MTKAKAKSATTARAARPAAAATKAPAVGKPVGTGPAPGVTSEQGIPTAGRIGKNDVTSRPVSPGNAGDPGPAATARPGGRRIAARKRVAEPEAEERDLGPLMRVQATHVGYIDNVRRREGDVFDVHEAEFSDRWMERVDDNTPERLTGPAASLKRIHDEALPGKLAKGAAADDPLGTKS